MLCDRSCNTTAYSAAGHGGTHAKAEPGHRFPRHSLDELCKAGPAIKPISIPLPYPLAGNFTTSFVHLQFYQIGDLLLVTSPLIGISKDF